jgi:Sec-independent protein translocase protein TatA
VLFLSPEKLLLVLVVAVIVLGPDKLPRAAREVATLWRTLTSLRARLEAEARSAIPELPSFASINDAMRSPLAYLDRLAGGPAEAQGEPATTPAPPREPRAGAATTPDEVAPLGRATRFVDPGLD